MALMMACSEDNTVDDEFLGWGALKIDTDTTTYSWQSGGSDDYLIIQGTLINLADTNYYAKMGDWNGSERTKLFFSKNSAGSIEKYNQENKTWDEVDILGTLIEEAKNIEIKPNEIYDINSHLSKNNGDIEVGTYRLRIEYYDKNYPDSTDVLYFDNSNPFEIL